AERADDAVDGFRIDQVVGQVVVDLAIGEIAAILAELDEHLEAVTAGFLLFRRELAACRDVFLALGTLAAPLGKRLEFRDHFAFIAVVIHEIIVIGIGILGGTARAAARGLAGARRGRGGTGACLLGSSLLRRRFLCGSLLRSGFLGGGLLGRRLLRSGLRGRRATLGVFPYLHCDSIDIAGRR